MRDIILKAIVGRPDTGRLYIPAGELRLLGANPDALEGVPDSRPLPILVADLKRLIGDIDGEEPGAE